jgi:hypothetical protein
MTPSRSINLPPFAAKPRPVVAAVSTVLSREAAVSKQLGPKQSGPKPRYASAYGPAPMAEPQNSCG